MVMLLERPTTRRDETPAPVDTQPQADALDWLDQLYENYHRQAIGLAYSVLRERAEAEDVVQEAFLAAWRARDRYDAGKGSTRTWLLTMVRNRAIDALRARQVRRSEALDEERPWPSECDVPSMVLADLDAAWVHSALAHLPPEQRRAVELAYFVGLTHVEIADKLAIPLGTVKGRLRLAMERLRTVLQPGAYAIAQS
jgi:RNA polymerase sigma-70 factor (ECF subfamily)